MISLTAIYEDGDVMVQVFPSWEEAYEESLKYRFSVASGDIEIRLSKYVPPETGEGGFNCSVEMLNHQLASEAESI